MILLVSLDQARAHVRSDTTADDADLTGKIAGASAAVLTYLKTPAWADSSGLVPVDSSGVAFDVPDDVQMATLLLIGEFYRNRDADQNGPVDESYGFGFLPRPVVALLFPYRVPTIGIPDSDRRNSGWRWGWWRGDCGCW